MEDGADDDGAFVMDCAKAKHGRNARVARRADFIRVKSYGYDTCLAVVKVFFHTFRTFMTGAAGK